MNKLSIIMYHYVRDLRNSRFPAIKGLDSSLFIEQIEYIRRHYNVVTMEQVISCIKGDTLLPPKAALLTFDDAYTDHYTTVFPILNRFSLQGSFFPPAKVITTNTVLDVNKIHFTLASVEDKSKILHDIKVMVESFKKEYGLESFEYYYKKLALRDRFDSEEVVFIKRLLQVELVEDLRSKMTDRLFAKYVDVPESVFSKELYMNEEQLSHLVRAGMHVGSHGYDHYWWNSLDKNTLEREIDLSMGFLQDIGVDLENWTACYPYGSYDTQTEHALEARGCQLALTTEVDVARVNKENRYKLPRLDTNDIPKDAQEKTDDWYTKG